MLCSGKVKFTLENFIVKIFQFKENVCPASRLTEIIFSIHL